MSDKAGTTNETAVGDQIQVDVVETARSQTSTSEELLRRIATLLFMLVAGLLTVFAYYASSLCITVVLAAFLAILVDPLVVMLEKLRLPRGVAAGVVVLAFIALIGLLGHKLYGRGTSFAEQLPVYASKLQQAIDPIIRKIEKVQQSAGSLSNDVQPSKRVPEVRLRESPSWPAYLVRGAGSVWGVSDYCRSGSISNVFHALQQGPNGDPNECPPQLEGRHRSIREEPQPNGARFRSRELYRRLRNGHSDHTDSVRHWHERRRTARNRQWPFESAAVPRPDLFSCASSCSGPTSVQHTRTIYRDHSNDPLPAYRLCEFSFSEIYCQSRQYRAGGGNRWDSVLGLVVGCHGLAAGCAAHSAR